LSPSYSSHRVHLSFSTKGRARIIAEELQPRLWAYMAGIAKKQAFDAIIIGGIQDHVHALLLLPPTIPLSKAVQFLKGSGFAWQEGYGAFSVSVSQTGDLIRYIKNQAAHHAKKSFEREFFEFLERYGITLRPGACAGVMASPPGTRSFVASLGTREPLFASVTQR
jgi:REP element-mobilizing transposase RayT